MNQSIEKVQNPERGRRIAEERKRLGLSQPALAEIGGIKKGSQILYEKGNAPTADYLERIAEAGADILFIVMGRREHVIQRPSGAIDTERLERSIEIIERGLLEGKRTPTPGAKAEMILAAYEMLDVPSPAVENRILRLVIG